MYYQNWMPIYGGVDYRQGQMGMGIKPPPGLLKTVQDCAAVCEHMTHMLHYRNDGVMRAKQQDLLRDCADICHTMTAFLGRHSRLSRRVAAVCAYICQRCANECMRFQDAESQHCARVCMHCARECQQFAESE